MKFSIIIPVRSITAFLRESIPHLRSLGYSDFEVLIVTDNFENFNFEGDLRFVLIVSGPISPGEKRNLGAQKAKGEILAFLDDDAYPTPNWLFEANKLFSQNDVYAVGGPAMTPTDAGFLEKMSGRVMESWLASGGTVYRHLPLPEREIDDYPSVNLLVRKDAFWAVGGFSKDFWPGEDTKLCLDMVQRYGRKFVYSPKPIVYHHRRNLFRPHLKQVSRYGRHRGQFARIFPQTSRVPSYFAPALFVLGLAVGLPICIMFPVLWYLYYGVLATYLFLLLIEAGKVIVKDKSIGAGVYFTIGVFSTHLIYGINFIIGLLKKPKLKLKAVDTRTGNYSEG